MQCDFSDQSRREKKIGGFLVLAICASFVLRYWNQYLSPMCGGDLFSMIAPSQGWLPYRDYYYQCPPGNILLLGWLGQLFGPKMITAWAFHSVLNVIAALGLYHVLLRVSSPVGAVLGSIAAFVIGSCDLGDTPSWYFHQLAAFTTFALLALLVAFQGVERLRSALWGIATGLCLGWAFAVKQTMAPVVLAFLLVPVVIALRQPMLRRWATLLFVSTTFGLAMVLLPVILWLSDLGILSSCIQQTVLHGPETKGPLLTVLMRPFVGLVDYSGHRAAAILAALTVAIMIMLSLRMRSAKEGRSLSPIERTLVAGMVCLVALFFGWGTTWAPFFVRTPTLALAAVATLGGFAFLALSTLLLLRDESPETLRLWIILFVSTALTYSASLGWALNEVAAFPGLGVVLAVFWTNIEQKVDCGGHALRLTTVVLIFLLLGYGAWRKMSEPCNLMSWGEPPITKSQFEPVAPELAGFQLSYSTAKFYDVVTDYIRQYVHPGDEIFAFPNMQVFYGIARAKSPTLCINHWFDICPDDIAIADARRLQEHPPALIIALDLPDEAYGLHETYFRQGKPSGQRVLWDSVMKLTQRYQKLATFRSNHIDLRPVVVWARDTKATPLQ